MCWYCENGLPANVKAIIEGRLDENPNAEFGPGHIVFSDFNLEDDNIRHCLDNIKNHTAEHYGQIGYTAEDMEQDRKALKALLAIPEAERDPAGQMTACSDCGAEFTIGDGHACPGRPGEQEW